MSGSPRLVSHQAAQVAGGGPPEVDGLPISAVDPATNIDMVAGLAHDLRNYMTSVYGNLDRIQRIATAQEHEKEAQLATSAIRILDQMLFLLNNVLDLLRANHGMLQLDFQPFDLVALVRQMAGLLTTDSHPVRVSAPAQLYVRGDVERLRQAIHNLLANALAYSPPGEPVDVTVTLSEGPSGHVARMRIRDYGPGIPPEQVSRLFKPFSPGPHSTGAGIGLSLASQIIIAHGGTIAVRPVEGHGACFEWTIPGSSEEQQAEFERRVQTVCRALHDLLQHEGR